MTQADLTRNLGMGAWNRPKAPAPKKAKPKPKPKPKPVYIKGARELGARPAAPKNIDPKAITTTAIQQGNRLSDAQEREYTQLYGTLAGQQRGEIDRIAAGLDNQYTQDARNQVNQSFGELDRMGALGNEASAIGDAAGANINALAPQVIGIGDQYMGDLRGQALNANQQAEAAAGRMDPLAGQVMGIGDQYMGQIGGLGQMLGDQARQGFATSGPTEIEAELYRQGQAELALGRSLSPEQMRDATQSARQGMAARGMATGQAALGAELLNRDRFASQRQAERRAFAGTANNLREENVMARRAAAGNMATASGNLFDTAGRMGMAGRELAGNLYDAAGRTRLAGTEIGGRLLDQAGRMGMAGRELAGNLYQTGANTQMTGSQIGGALLGDAGRLRLDGARTTADLDPFARAMTPGLSLGQTAQQMGLNTTGNNFGNTLQLGANAASFNTNMAGDLFTNWQNNAAAIKGANTTAQATRDASRRTTGDYIIGGLQALNPFG